MNRKQQEGLEWLFGELEYIPVENISLHFVLNDLNVMLTLFFVPALQYQNHLVELSS